MASLSRPGAVRRKVATEAGVRCCSAPSLTRYLNPRRGLSLNCSEPLRSGRGEGGQQGWTKREGREEGEGSVLLQDALPLLALPRLGGDAVQGQA